jgi:hypothetical protein
MYEEQDFVKQMFQLINWQGIPATSSDEVTEVLRYHLNNMERMNRDSLEFLAALECAKVLDNQRSQLRTRERFANDPEFLWVPIIK